MKTVVIASMNPVKIQVAKLAFAHIFSDEFVFESHAAASGVADQPHDKETFIGAQNRLISAERAYPNAAYWISMEGGLYSGEEFFNDGELWNRAWILVADKSGFIGKAQTAAFLLPKEVAQLVRGGMESGDAYDQFFQTRGAKSSGGGVHFLTDGAVSRTNLYLEAAYIALSQLKHKDWFA